MSDAGCSDSLWPESLIQYDIRLEKLTENLALDEALLSAVESDPTAAALRIWEWPEYCVVLGRSNELESEVNVAVCDAEGIPILRRVSGGGTVLLGPGCLCYTLALPLNEGLSSMGISQVSSKLMERIARGLRSALSTISVHGTSDLVWNDRKFSGNAQRWLRRSFIHHGTILYDFDISRIARYLNHPAREPDYRQRRNHADFVTNIPLESDAVRSSLSSTWNAVSSQCPTAILEASRQISESHALSKDWQPMRNGHDMR